jgi:adenosylcobyric acid synthase
MLDVETVLTADKTLRRVQGRLAGREDAAFRAYEIHVGETSGPATAKPFARLDGGAAEGARSADGRVAGCYLHGLFDAAPARAALLEELGAPSDGVDALGRVDAALDELAAALAASLDIEALARMAGIGRV